MIDTLIETFTTLVQRGDTHIFLLPIYSTLLLGERIFHEFIDPERKWNNADTGANLFITITVLVLNMLIGHLLPLAAFSIIYNFAHLFEFGQSGWGWFAAFILYDLAWYVDHRIGHRISFFWAMHHVHHSSVEYNMTVASRGFVVDTTLLSRPTFYLLPLIGISPFQFIAISIFTNIWGIAQHTRLVGKLGWIDWLFATPSNHRVHHGSNDKYLDKNYGEVLMIWDHLFGTYQAEEEEPSYGVTDPINTNNPLRIEVAGILWFANRINNAKTLPGKLLSILMPPEWLPHNHIKEIDKAGLSGGPVKHSLPNNPRTPT